MRHLAFTFVFWFLDEDGQRRSLPIEADYLDQAFEVWYVVADELRTPEWSPYPYHIDTLVADHHASAN